ncbi:MAG: amino acid permease [Candidatus Latescibacteria bacterium]|nr:amino acid permease [Candidatus Latescibacterota bacterium]
MGESVEQTTSDVQASAEPQLLRGLGLVESTTLVVGGIIGSGIFLVPSIVARETGAPGLSLAVWVVCAVLATCGALCYAELSAALPETGGTYPFLRRAYRVPIFSFLFGWSLFFVIMTGAIGAVATAFASYAGYFLGQAVPYGPWTQRLVAVSCILFLTAMNCLGVRVGGQIQNLFTFLKVAALVGLIGVGLLFGHRAGTPLTPFLPAAKSGSDLVTAFGTAMITTLFAYNGWYYSSFMAGEITQPQRTIPRSLILSMGIVLVIYLLANYVYLSILPFEHLQASTLVAADAMKAVIGPVGGGLIALAVMVSTFGTVNAQLLATPRVYYAMSRDRLFFGWINRVHPRFHTPTAAILFQGIWASGFALSGTYRQIITYAAFTNYLFLSMAVAGVLILRRREPLLHRPYRVWGYPVTPILFLLVSAGYLITSLIGRFQESMVGVALMLVGVPFYFYWSRRSRTIQEGSSR